jgi:hypothetical protein
MYKDCREAGAYHKWYICASVNCNFTYAPKMPSIKIISELNFT